MKVVFVDRDGVINEDTGYVYKKESFNFIEGVFTSLKYLTNKGFNLIVITNQSGIGRGYFKEEEYNSITNWMVTKLRDQDISILDIFYCPHKPEDNCQCRKPKTGMFESASKKYKINKENSWTIGDKETDIIAAHNFGIYNTILVESGYKIDKKNSKAKFILPSIKQVSTVIY